MKTEGIKSISFILGGRSIRTLTKPFGFTSCLRLRSNDLLYSLTEFALCQHFYQYLFATILMPGPMVVAMEMLFRY